MGMIGMEENDRETQYVICIKNEGYPASLELRKVYQKLPDAQAEAHAMIRLIDESGEGYLYPDAFFLPIRLPQAVKKAFTQVA